MKHIVQNTFGDDDPGNKDLNDAFSQLDQLKPPADFVHRVMQAVSRLPLPQMLQPGDEQTWDDEILDIHRERKQPS
jgi:hypothetical protein